MKVASWLTTDRAKEDNGEGHYSGVTGAGSTMPCLLSASIEMMTGRSGGSPRGTEAGSCLYHLRLRRTNSGKENMMPTDGGILP